MAYRNGTYVAFDGQGTTDPTKSDMKYYALLQSWNKGNKYQLSFSDSHKKTYQVLDSSTKKTLENRLLDRLRNSKNMLLIISEETNYNRGMLNFEIEKAIDLYDIPIIVAYTGCDYLLDYDRYKERWPKALADRIEQSKGHIIHIAFKEKTIMEAIDRFTVHSTGKDILQGTGYVYSKDKYRKWGYCV